MQHTGFIAIELHEYEVPDLDVAITILFRRSRWTTPDLRTMVIENFSTRTTRTSICHLPEVIRCVAGTLIITNPNNALFGYADFIGPDVVGFVVFLIHRHPEFFFRQAVDTRQQFPRKVDGITLEVIAKAEVAQHFKECVMTCGITDILQVIMFATRTHAALRRGCTCIRTFVLPQKHIFELNHPRIGEKQGGIISRNQRAGRHNGVPFGFVETKKLFPDFGAFHNGEVLILMQVDVY